MKIPLTILAIVVLMLGLFQWLAPPPGPDTLRARSDLPWQIEPAADGGSRVFDLDLGEATLGDAMAKFGAIEGLALFQTGEGRMSLEAFFGNVRFGPLNAKVVVALEAAERELAMLRERSTQREGSPSGDWKYPLAEPPGMHAARRIRVITYIPGTRDLDQQFFRERFGEPAAWRRENEHALSWFYPEYGLSILIDEKAREALEYQPPRDFVMPGDVTPNPAR